MRTCVARSKQNSTTHRKIEYWVIPPEANAEFVANMEEVLEGRYPHCPKVILVSDNLNTHTNGAFYAAFPPGASSSIGTSD